MQEETFVEAPVKCDKERRWTRLPMIDPHQLTHYLFTAAGMAIDMDLVRSFWQESRRNGEPWAMESPAGDSHIPIALYGDGATIYNRQPPLKVIGLFISYPLWRSASNRCSRFAIFSLEENMCWGNDTLDCILYRIVYSLNLLFDGDATLANGHKFCLTEVRGDWSWFKYMMCLKSSWQRLDQLRFLCDAKGQCRDSSRLFYNCWSEDPNWNEYSLLDFINAELAHRRRPCATSYN